MFGIQCNNKLYKENRYIGIRDTNLPYLIYEGNLDYLKNIHPFNTKDEALSYLTRIINREGIDICELTTSQIVDLTLVNNNTSYQIIEFEIDDNKLKVIERHKLPQFSRKSSSDSKEQDG